MRPFRFEPDLFEHRATLLECLDESGFEWFSHFFSIDLMHECFGLEMCGIVSSNDAEKIQSVARKAFPSWRYSNIGYSESARELGWKVTIHRDNDDSRGEKSWA
jgi:hypothetical protein